MSDIVFTEVDAVRVADRGPVALKRAERAVRLVEDEHGRKGLGFAPARGEWSPWTTRVGTQNAFVAIVVLVGCPSCGGVIYLPHTPNSATALSRIMHAPVRVTHMIDPKGRVSPGISCPHGCGFERGVNAVKLEGWSRVKKLYSALVRKKGSLHLETVYTHAADRHEALVHIAPGKDEVIEAGPAVAVGWLGDERTGKIYGG